MLYFLQVEGTIFYPRTLLEKHSQGKKEREDEGVLLGFSTSGSGLRTACADDRECPPLSLPDPSTPPCGCWVKCSARPLLLSWIPGSMFRDRHQGATLWSSAPAIHSSPALPTTEWLCSSCASFFHGFIMQKRKKGVTGISKGTAAKCLLCRLGHSQGAGAVQKK